MTDPSISLDVGNYLWSVTEQQLIDTLRNPSNSSVSSSVSLSGNKPSLSSSSSSSSSTPSTTVPRSLSLSPVEPPSDELSSSINYATHCFVCEEDLATLSCSIGLCKHCKRKVHVLCWPDLRVKYARYSSSSSLSSKLAPSSSSSSQSRYISFECLRCKAAHSGINDTLLASFGTLVRASGHTHSDICNLCSKENDLILCDGCSFAVHADCLQEKYRSTWVTEGPTGDALNPSNGSTVTKQQQSYKASIDMQKDDDNLTNEWYCPTCIENGKLDEPSIDEENEETIPHKDDGTNDNVEQDTTMDTTNATAPSTVPTTATLTSSLSSDTSTSLLSSSSSSSSDTPTASVDDTLRQLLPPHSSLTGPLAYDGVVMSSFTDIQEIIKTIQDERMNDVQRPLFEYVKICRDLRPKHSSRSTTNDPSATGTTKKRNYKEEDTVSVCECAKANTHCDHTCLNRAVLSECTAATCGYGKDENKLCSNRALQRRTMKKSVPRPTPGKGWGLFAEEDIHPGDFIVEYVGDLLDANLVEQRMQEYVERQAKHFYMLEVTSDHVIDAGLRGNESRFINHACDPNSGALKMRVGNDVRVGIYATKFIPQGTEITYDYAFVNFAGERWECQCGAKICRKVLGFNKRDAVRDDIGTLLGSNVDGGGKTVPHAGHVLYDLDSVGVTLNNYGNSNVTTNSTGNSSTSSFIGIPKPTPASLLLENPSNRIDIARCVHSRVFIRGKSIHIPNRYDDGHGLNRLKENKRNHHSSSSTVSTLPSKRKGLSTATYDRFQDLEYTFTQRMQAYPELVTASYGWCAANFVNFYETAKDTDDAVGETGNENVCSKCFGPGQLLCCDQCPRSYHISCVGAFAAQQANGDHWLCPACFKASKQASRRSSAVLANSLNDLTSNSILQDIPVIEALARKI